MAYGLVCGLRRRWPVSLCRRLPKQGRLNYDDTIRRAIPFAHRGDRRIADCGRRSRLVLLPVCRTVAISSNALANRWTLKTRAPPLFQVINLSGTRAHNMESDQQLLPEPWDANCSILVNLTPLGKANSTNIYGTNN